MRTHATICLLVSELLPLVTSENTELRVHATIGVVCSFDELSSDALDAVKNGRCISVVKPLAGNATARP